VWQNFYILAKSFFLYTEIYFLYKKKFFCIKKSKKDDFADKTFKLVTKKFFAALIIF